MRRVLGIDLGARRIGLAVSDELGLAAHPRETIPRRGGARDLEGIRAALVDSAAERVVLGLPLDPDGSEGAAARRTRAFAARLRAALAVPVDLVDESFSTVEAERVLLQADLSRARRRQVVDRVAAAVILQRWLDARRGRGEVGAP